MRYAALIPARGGSQRAPRKNIADLGGKPLIAWTIETARASDAFVDITVSTDDAEITEVALRYKAKVISRPAHLSRNDTPMLPVVRHFMDKATWADAVMVLQPTSPFRSAQDIADCIGLLESFNGDAVVSVTDIPEDFAFEIGHANRLRERKQLVMPNGAIYLITREAIGLDQDWYSGLSYAFKMPKERSLDIDTPLDLEIARMLASRLRAA